MGRRRPARAYVLPAPRVPDGLTIPLRTGQQQMARRHSLSCQIRPRSKPRHLAPSDIISQHVERLHRNQQSKSTLVDAAMILASPDRWRPLKTKEYLASFRIVLRPRCYDIECAGSASLLYSELWATFATEICQGRQAVHPAKYLDRSSPAHRLRAVPAARSGGSTPSRSHSTALAGALLFAVGAAGTAMPQAPKEPQQESPRDAPTKMVYVSGSESAHSKLRRPIAAEWNMTTAGLCSAELTSMCVRRANAAQPRLAGQRREVYSDPAFSKPGVPYECSQPCGLRD